jgi:SAM-dependent methyltransferase
MAHQNQWTENDTQEFLELAEVFVPDRQGQFETLLRLLPAGKQDHFQVVELGAGAGLLAEAILDAFPAAQVLALDGSEKMRQLMAERLARFGSRVRIESFDLAASDWRQAIARGSVRCFLSSLCVHHLDGAEKRQLFHDLSARLEKGGALLLADVVEPENATIARLYADTLDEIVRKQSLTLYGDLRDFQQFEKLQWNYFRYDYGVLEKYDKPSGLHEQLRWLLERGFSWSDCFWFQAGFAIYGGFKHQ